MTTLPSAMFPLMPTDNGSLQDLARDVLTRSSQLSGMLHPKSQLGIVELIRLINSYYSNLIEGRSTHPAEIERAMRKDYSADSVKRNLQMESLAHIHCQQALEDRLEKEPDLDPSDPAFLSWVHREFYSKLPEELHWVENTKTGKRFQVIGGEFREHDVEVGRHLPPEHDDVPLFLERFFDGYRRGKHHGIIPIVATAAAHHRLAWIHPFLDGNGRVARLYIDACLRTLPVPGYGLWNVSRGLARKRDEYMHVLDEADSQRQSDFDGRGNLSNKALVKFCEFVLEVCLDQIDYMTEMLRLDDLLERFKGYVQMRHLKAYPPPPGHPAGMKIEAARMMQEVLLRGEVTRGEVAAAAGSARTGRDILPQLLNEGILVSSMPKGPVRLAFPTHLAGHLFPELYPMGARSS
jgi:Fic family protein